MSDRIDTIVAGVNRKDETEADNELEQHRDIHHVKPLDVQVFQHGDHDRDHGRSYRSGAGKAQMYDDQECGENCEDCENSHVYKTHFRNEFIGYPHGRFRI